jgi:hypothetical protein
VAEARGQFGNPEEEEEPPFETITGGVTKRVTEDTSECVCVSRAVTSSRNPIYSHSPNV